MTNNPPSNTEISSISTRPNWDEYFLSLAFHVSIRSEDPDIKHGAVIVDEENHILGTGYNNPIVGADNSKIPFNIRDKKRLWFLHAEENSLLNTVLRKSNCRIYVTGKPCVNCLQRIINFGIKEIIHADRMGTVTDTPETEEMRKNLIEMSGVQIRKISMENTWLRQWMGV
jgi:dCMP deaminase